jgi:hypothetical protein
VKIPLSLPQYFSIGFALIVLGRAIHYVAVTRYLTARGISITRAGALVPDWKEWAAYRKARLSDQKPLTLWYVLWAIQIILLFWMLGWFAYGAGAMKIATSSHLRSAAGDTDGYTTVFDVAESGYRQWPFAAFGLIFVAVGVALPSLIKIGVFRKPPVWMQKWFPRVFLGFAILWTLGAFAGTFIDYRRAVDALQNGEAKVVEGRVAHYWQVPQKSESFDVQGVRFQYSDFGIIAGFNHIASLGGPIREGLLVKIWYWHGEILRLQIKKEPNQALQPTAGRRDASLYLMKTNTLQFTVPPASGG